MFSIELTSWFGATGAHENCVGGIFIMTHESSLLLISIPVAFVRRSEGLAMSLATVYFPWLVVQVL